MKKTLRLFLLTMTCFIGQHLSAQDCASSSSLSNLNANNVSCLLSPNGSFWWDGSDGGYFYPTNSPAAQVSAIFAGGIWAGGKDAAGNFLVAGSEYGMGSGNVDYHPGPLNEQGETSLETCSDFDRIFVVNNDALQAHLADFMDDGMINGEVAETILGWPGNGNPEFSAVHGFELPAFNFSLAPYVDRNSDGIYNPMDGDYPAIKGADQAHWWVFNDNSGVHNETQGAPLGFEFQVLAYAYAAAEPVVNDATFYDMKIINRSGQAVEDFYLGIFADVDLGCYTDDYIGCIPEENLGFVYNQDATDGEDGGCVCQGLTTYCEEIPVVGIKMLSGLKDYATDPITDLGMSSFTYYNNQNPAPPAGTGGPGIAGEYYNFLQGLWQDGTPFTQGGFGYNPGSTDVTSFAFPGNPSDGSVWSMCSEDLAAGDRRFLMSSGPILVDPGAINTISFAVIAQPAVAHPCPDITQFVEYSNEISNFFEVTSTMEIEYNSTNLAISPNPFSDQTTISLKGDEAMIETLNVFSFDGKLVRSYQAVHTTSIVLDRVGMTAGMYFYELQTTNDKILTGKIVVQ